MTIDHALMYIAVSDTAHAGGPKETAYMNRLTGEIAFIADDLDEAAGHYGPLSDADRLNMAARRAAVENRPSDWVDIPKNRRLPVHHKHWCETRTYRADLPRGQRDCTCGARQTDDLSDDEFIRDFLRKNGINAEW